MISITGYWVDTSLYSSIGLLIGSRNLSEFLYRNSYLQTSERLCYWISIEYQVQSLQIWIYHFLNLRAIWPQQKHLYIVIKYIATKVCMKGMGVPSQKYA